MTNLHNDQARYTLEENYKDAIKNTDEGYSPIAFCIAPLDPSFTWPPGYPVASISQCKQVSVAMTTVFADEQFNGSWGWFLLPTDIERQLGDILIDREETGWTYWSQQKVGDAA